MPKKVGLKVRIGTFFALTLGLAIGLMWNRYANLLSGTSAYAAVSRTSYFYTGRLLPGGQWPLPGTGSGALAATGQSLGEDRNEKLVVIRNFPDRSQKQIEIDTNSADEMGQELQSGDTLLLLQDDYDL